MLNRLMRGRVSRIIDPVARGILRLGLTPNQVTLLGTAGATAGAVGLLGTGHLLAGTVMSQPS
jgi:CDP-diacylglycerol--glycerol-3-phosphate 3-phosphatidyltransferase